MSINLIRPVGGFVSSPFGMRNGVLHAGVDLAVGQGTPIHAAASGTVTRAAWFDGYGNCVDINHGGNVMTRYGHMMQLPSVKQGQSVNQGTVIGYVGSTGDSTGNHLHFEVRINGNPVDPWPYINGKAVPSDGSVATGVQAASLTGSIQGLDKFANIVSDRNTFIRIGMFGIGGVLLTMGLIFIMGGSASIPKGVKQIVKSS